MQNSDTSSTSANSAALIDLKAELFRKQEEFKAHKLQNQNAPFIKGKTPTTVKKPNLFSKKNAGVAQRAEKDYEEKLEEEDVFEKSKRSLENKSKLYAKITSGTEIPEEDGSGLYLVDFQKKVIDDVIEKKRKKERQEQEEKERREAEEEIRMLREPVPAPEDEDEQWVDYVDSFGRSRRCLRKDLPQLQGQTQSRETLKEEPTLLSADMKRELDRQKWEKEQEENMQKDNIHYADVQFNEVRTHGVGYYQFDRAEATREEQMQKLKDLRQETKTEQSKRERIKEKRKAALAARLAKVKQRKREKAGLPGRASDEEDKPDSDEEIGPKLAEKIEPEPLTRDDTWRATATLEREWDKGKERTLERSHEAWVEKQRAERDEEFAPPTFYFDEPKGKRRPDKDMKISGQSTVISSDIRAKSDVSKSTRDWVSHSEDSLGIGSVVQQQLQQIRREGLQKTSLSKNENMQTGTPDLVPKSKSAKSEQLHNQFEDISNIPLPGQSAGVTSQHNPIMPQSVPSAPLSNFSYPPPNFGAQASNFLPPVHIPPPSNILSHNNPPSENVQSLENYSTPFNIPPPNTNIPPPNTDIPPLNTNIPPPNVNLPPPGYASSLPSSQTPGPHYPAHYAGTQSAGSQPDSMNQSTQQQQTGFQISSTVPTKTKHVPKMSIIDTRLMANEDI